MKASTHPAGTQNLQPVLTIQDAHSREHRRAADEEYESLIENGTWELVELLGKLKVIGITCKWVFRGKYKHKQRGNVAVCTEIWL